MVHHPTDPAATPVATPVAAPDSAAVLTVLTTTDAGEKADALARGAVAARVAACAQISGPVTSVYRWRGEVVAEREWQVHFKTTDARFEALAEYLRAEHDYETPEIIATPVTHGDPTYLAWVVDETRPE